MKFIEGWRERLSNEIFLYNYFHKKFLLFKGGFKSEDTGKNLSLQHKYSKSLSWAENLNKLFTVLGGKFKFSAQDSDLEYLCWRHQILQYLLT